MASSTCAGTEREFLNARGLVGRLRFGWVAAWAAVVEAKRHHRRASDTSEARDLGASCPSHQSVFARKRLPIPYPPRENDSRPLTHPPTGTMKG